MKPRYKRPSFVAASVATICSKMGCPPSQAGAFPTPSMKKARETAYGSSIPVMPGDISVRADSELTYIFEPAAQLVFELNETAALVLRSIDGERSLDDIVGVIRQRYANVPRSVDAHIYGLIENLRATGLRISFV